VNSLCLCGEWLGAETGAVISNGYRRAVLHEDEQVQDWWLGFDG